MDPGAATPYLNYTTGMFIIAMLLVVFLLLRRQLPGTCETCAFVKERPGMIGYEKFCRKKCMYNPPHRGAVGQSLYEPKESAVRTDNYGKADKSE